MNWQKAFLQQYQDACVGRLVRGILHNLNGVNQAFSLQAALFDSMFTQADRLISSALDNKLDSTVALTEVRSLLLKRFPMVRQMEEKVKTSQSIVNRTQPLARLYDPELEISTELSNVINLEVEILSADPFFKHHVNKFIELDSNIPVIHHNVIELHAIIFSLLKNALEAMRSNENRPSMRIVGSIEVDNLVIKVCDTGSGVCFDDMPHLFEPFFTTKSGRIGVGLYLAHKAVDTVSGAITCESSPGNTCFQVLIPLSNLVSA